METWLDVVGYEGLYKVSNIGRVKSLDMVLPYNRYGIKKTRTRKGKILTQVKMKNGYLRVMLSRKCKTSFSLVHRLVAMAFIPNPKNHKEINHINCNKQDNSVENLEWASSSQNKIHGLINGLYKIEKPILQIKDGNIIKEYRSAMECYRQTGFSPQFIGKVALGKRKRAYGYQWKFKERG